MKMRKGFKLLTVGLMTSIICTLFIGCGIKVVKLDDNKESNNISIFNSDGSKDVKRYEVDEKHLIEAEDFQGIKDIVAEIAVASVKIIPEDREDLEVHFYGHIVTDNEFNNHESSVECKNKKVYIKTYKKKASANGFSNSSKFNMDIHIPKNYSEDFHVTVGVGSLDINKMNFSSIEVDTGVGDINIDDLTGKLSVEVGVGSTDIEVSTLKEDIEISSGTGEVVIRLPEDGDFELSADTGVGSIDSQFKGGKRNGKNSLNQKNGEGTYDIDLDTGVGSIKIKSE